MTEAVAEATVGPAILVLDDDDEVRNAISAMLTDAGFRVTTATTAWEALALVEEHYFDMLVADVALPGGLDGLEMAKRMRTRHPELKCLFISGAIDPKIIDPRLDDFLSKPFRPSLLVGSVWKVLRGNQPYPRIEIAR